MPDLWRLFVPRYLNRGSERPTQLPNLREKSYQGTQMNIVQRINFLKWCAAHRLPVKRFPAYGERMAKIWMNVYVNRK
jgi:hypothetical protein